MCIRDRHKVDNITPLAETVETMGEIIASGKVLYWGLSNYRSWRMAEIIRLCEQMGVPKPVVCQPYYNAMNRMPEVEVLPACAHYGMGVVPYSPLARGVLTGKYDPKAKPGKGTRAGRGDQRILETEFRKESLVMAQRIKAHAEKRGTFTNVKGRVQKFMKALEPPGDALPEWEVLHELVHNVTGLDGFKSIEGLFNQMAGEVKSFKEAELTWAGLGDLGADVKL